MPEQQPTVETSTEVVTSDEDGQTHEARRNLVVKDGTVVKDEKSES